MAPFQSHGEMAIVDERADQTAARAAQVENAQAGPIFEKLVKLAVEPR